MDIILCHHALVHYNHIISSIYFTNHRCIARDSFPMLTLRLSVMTSRLGIINMSPEMHILRFVINGIKLKRGYKWCRWYRFKPTTLIHNKNIVWVPQNETIHSRSDDLYLFNDIYIHLYYSSVSRKMFTSLRNWAIVDIWSQNLWFLSDLM